MPVIALTLHRAKIDYTDLPEPNEVQGSVTENLNTRQPPSWITSCSYPWHSRQKADVGGGY